MAEPHMKLYYSPNSPYARKVRVLAIERGISDQIELVEVSTADLNGPLMQVNPLGRVPALQTDADGMVHDSPVICEYLDGYTSNSSGAGKVIDLTDKCFAATAQGMLDAGYAVRMEKTRPEHLQWQDWKDKQFGKISRTLDQIEANPAALPNEPTIGAIALACTIEWLQFRHPEGQWLENRPALAQWVHAFGQRPSMQATRPV
jgi:glutathione S-transferase